MFVDAQLEFSDSQAITASAASTNIIDFNPAFDYNTVIDAGAGEPTFLVVTPSVTFAAAGAATLAIELRAYANEDKSDTPTVIFSTPAKALGSLVAGKPVVVVALPSANYKRFLSLQYTVATGPFTAGALDAFITKDAQTWRSYANNVEFAALNLSIAYFGWSECVFRGCGPCFFMRYYDDRSDRYHESGAGFLPGIRPSHGS